MIAVVRGAKVVRVTAPVRWRNAPMLAAAKLPAVIVVGFMAAEWVSNPHSIVYPVLLFANAVCVAINLVSFARRPDVA